MMTLYEDQTLGTKTPFHSSIMTLLMLRDKFALQRQSELKAINSCLTCQKGAQTQV